MTAPRHSASYGLIYPVLFRRAIADGKSIIHFPTISSRSAFRNNLYGYRKALEREGALPAEIAQVIIHTTYHGESPSLTLTYPSPKPEPLHDPSARKGTIPSGD